MALPEYPSLMVCLPCCLREKREKAMKLGLLDVLVCPMCRNTLNVEIVSQHGEEHNEIEINEGDIALSYVQ